MTQQLFTILAILFLFGVTLLGFTYGLRLGMTTAKGEIPKPIKNPVKAVLEVVENHEAKKEADKLDQEFTDIMSATKESMLDAMKKGVV